MTPQTFKTNTDKPARHLLTAVPGNALRGVALAEVPHPAVFFGATFPRNQVDLPRLAIAKGARQMPE